MKKKIIDIVVRTGQLRRPFGIFIAGVRIKIRKIARRGRVATAACSLTVYRGQTTFFDGQDLVGSVTIRAFCRRLVAGFGQLTVYDQATMMHQVRVAIPAAILFTEVRKQRVGTKFIMSLMTLDTTGQPLSSGTLLRAAR